MSEGFLRLWLRNDMCGFTYRTQVNNLMAVHRTIESDGRRNRRCDRAAQNRWISMLEITPPHIAQGTAVVASAVEDHPVAGYPDGTVIVTGRRRTLRSN